MASGKRCHYEVLGVSRESTADEIRSAYKKLALQLHPDKLVQSGLSQAEATSKFQELSHAYEVLSDPKERAWYDSHRSQILFSEPDAARDSFVPDLFSYFSNTVFSGYGATGKGFYKVYSDVFDRVYANEVSFVRKLGLGMEKLREAPVMGNFESPYEQVTAFYNYWLGFSTIMDFCWVDRYDAGAGVNRKSRRVMEDENNKLRRKARREYNDTVRGLAEFVKKRDKRVIDMMLKRSKEAERKQEEEKERKKRLARERMERARGYEEPEWARVDEEEIEGFDEEGEVEEGGKKSGKGVKFEELYCVVCGKKFKSEKQWKNHEQSKKHKDKVAELRHSFKEEDVGEDEEEEGKYMDVFDEYELGKNDRVDPDVDEIEERLKEGFNMGEEESIIGVLKSEDGEDEFLDAEDGNSGGRAGEEDVNFDKVDEEDKDEEMGVLEATLSGRKSWRTRGSRRMVEDIGGEVYLEIKNQEADDLQYDSQKSRRRRSKKERGRNDDKDNVNGDNDEGKSQNEETNELDNETLEESSSHSFVKDENSVKRSAHLSKNQKSSNISVHRKESLKKETNTRLENLMKGKKGKAASKDSGNVCQTCGEEFDSRNKLHKHLGNTGHASLKY